MAIRCGNCKGLHISVAETRLCYNAGRLVMAPGEMVERTARKLHAYADELPFVKLPASFVKAVANFLDHQQGKMYMHGDAITIAEAFVGDEAVPEEPEGQTDHE